MCNFIGGVYSNMSFNLGNKSVPYVKVNHINGLDHIEITDADVRTGKVSINKYGEKVEGQSTQRFLEQMTSDATALASDINKGKTLWVNGSLITGTYSALTPELAIRGITKTYTVASTNNITAGNFVKLIGNTVGKITSKTDVILGIATKSGSAGQSITVKVPF